MDGELARGTLINGRSLAQTTFAPATNTKELLQQYKHKNTKALQYKHKNTASANTKAVRKQIEKN